MKKYEVYLSECFETEFRRIDEHTQKILLGWIGKNIIKCNDPRLHGKPIKGGMEGFWRYKAGEYRMICQILEDELIMLAITTGYRRQICRLQHLGVGVEQNIDE